AHQEKCVAVRWGTHDRFGADIGAAPCTIFDDELLAEPLREPRSDEPRKNVGRAARSRRGDDTHRPRRIALRVSEPGHCRQRGSACCEMQKISAGKFHSEPPSHHSITSSAMASSPGGKLRPNALAVLRLITNSNLIDCMTGRSAGFSPLRTRPT